jgi:hypothetical protein
MEISAFLYMDRSAINGQNNCLYFYFQCLEGGKVQLWDLEVGEDICSTRNTDDDAVTCVKVRLVLSKGGRFSKMEAIIEAFPV